ncbi:sensor histidine kinase [Paenibacillus antri]|uniref:Sensor histidine kinase n=1 Tax=Paenibacillus antri TaxID=2582848 RepID=A0A5R9GNT9_9BACL|nr:histidine kinase [Paenibacillus antri]TLS53815.1 sensor histidine kinase [Paenibacillus antri]
MWMKMNIFQKGMVTLIVLLGPFLILFLYSNRISENVVRSEIAASTVKQLSFFLSQVETNIEQLDLFAITLGTDSTVREFKDMREDARVYQMVEVKTRMLDKLRMHNAIGGWTNQLTVYSPRLRTGVTTLASIDYERKFASTSLSTRRWSYRLNDLYGQERHTFVKHEVLPAAAEADPRRAELIVEVGFTEDSIVKMLDDFKIGGTGDPFLYHPSYRPITNRSAERTLIGLIIGGTEPPVVGDSGHRTVKLEGRDYLLSYVRSESLGWYLIDYIPVEEILSPIRDSRNTFFFAAGLMVTLGVLSAYLLYKHVQMPIVQLVRGVQRLKIGDYSARIAMKQSGEFDFLFTRFNEMAEQIQELIERVYQEKLRSKEAKLKQLQSQINPHFLYNCFAFIKSMAQLGKNEPVVAMALNLSKYYRYTTRIESEDTTIREEMELIANYLNIQRLQMPRFNFSVDIPERMMDAVIPRLIIQPAVENAVVHGIEPMEAPGMIHIYGLSDGDEHRIVVEDNGVGLAPEALFALKRKLSLPQDEETGYGMWNVHQRMVHRFGKGAGLEIASPKTGGCIVTLHWRESTGNKEG